MKKYFDEIRNILKAFKIEESFPSVFNVNILPKYVSFIEQLDVSRFPKEFREVYIILEFVKMMRSARQKIFNDMGVASSLMKIVPDNVYIKLIALQMESLGSEVWNSIRKSGLLDAFSVDQQTYTSAFVDSKWTVTCTSVLSLKRSGTPLDAVLETLRGSLFNTATLPPALRQRYQRLNTLSRSKSLLKAANVIVKDSSVDKWLNFDSNSKFTLHMMRCKEDKIIVRYTVVLPAVPTFKNPAALSKTLIKLWRQSFQKL